MKRSPLKRGLSQLKRTPLAKMSKKRKAENVERRDAMEEAFGPRDEWVCAVTRNPVWKLGMGNCFGPVHGHEIVKRSQGGSITDTKNIVLLCAYHNGWVEDQRNSAHDLGLVRSNWEVQ